MTPEEGIDAGFNHVSLVKRTDGAIPAPPRGIRVPDPQGHRAKRVDTEHIRVRAYFMWEGKHKDFPAWTATDYWLAAEKIEKYYA